MSLQELKKAIGTTEQDIEADVMLVKKEVETKEGARLITERAIERWAVRLKDAEDQRVERCVACWIQGLSEAYEVLFELLGDYSEEEAAFFPSKEEKSRDFQSECKRWLHQDAMLLMKTAPKKWPITIQGIELTEGENDTLGLCGSCYLQGLYIGYYNIMERIEIAEKKLLSRERIDLDRLLCGIPMSEDEQLTVVTRNREVMDQQETRDIIETAVRRYPVTLKDGKDRSAERFVSCFLYGMEGAYDDVVNNFTDASAAERAIFEGCATTDIQVMYLLREQGREWKVKEAEKLADYSIAKWDVKITGFEVMPDENKMLSLCCACYLQGMYSGYQHIARSIRKELKRIAAREEFEESEATPRGEDET